MFEVRKYIAGLSPNEVDQFKVFTKRKGANRYHVLESRGELLLQLVTKFNHKKIWEEFLDKGIVLPPYEGIKRAGMEEDELYIIKSAYYEAVAYGADVYEQLSLPGYLFDKNSSPRAARGVVDNDDPQLLESAWWHDPAFALKWVSFRVSNAFHYWRGRANGNKRWNSIIAWMGISSIFGKKSYKGNDPRTHWLKDFVILIKNGKIIHEPRGF